MLSVNGQSNGTQKLRHVKNTPQIAPSKTECLLSSTSAIGFSLIAAISPMAISQGFVTSKVSKGVSEWWKNMFEFLLVHWYKTSGKPKKYGGTSFGTTCHKSDLFANKEVFLSTFGQSRKKHEFDRWFDKGQMVIVVKLRSTDLIWSEPQANGLARGVKSRFLSLTANFGSTIHPPLNPRKAWIKGVIEKNEPLKKYLPIDTHKHSKLMAKTYKISSKTWFSLHKDSIKTPTN